MEKKLYRVTWRHEIEFEADSDEEARDIWATLDISPVCSFDDESIILRDGFVEEKSFECVSDDYREVGE